MPPDDLSRLTGFTAREATSLFRIQEEIVGCTDCPRLRAWCEQVAIEKRRAYREEIYWGRPVPAFGDPSARILIIGLAPAAHGANRTGRMFTSDSSGSWLFRALHEAGLASRPDSERPGDGLILTDVLITAAVRCAPPANRPTGAERRNCLRWITGEVGLLADQLRVVLALGHFAFTGWFQVLQAMGVTAPSPRPKFAHGATSPSGFPGVTLLAAYHPSRQNTNTGLLTWPMWSGVIEKARRLAVQAR